MSIATVNRTVIPATGNDKLATQRLRVPFGLKDGRMWTARQVSAGRSCGCVCPACGGALIAKAQESRRRRAHFAHLVESNCRTGFETAVHRKAKQLIVDQLFLQLPAWDGEDDMPNPPRLLDEAGMVVFGRAVELPARTVTLNWARAELQKIDYKPDVTGEDEKGELLIEIRVTHAVDDLKQRRVRSEGKRMLEIDLSKLRLEQVEDDQEFERQVLGEAANRQWISCPAASEDWRAALQDLKLALAGRNAEIAKARQLAEDRNRVLAEQMALARQAQATALAEQQAAQSKAASAQDKGREYARQKNRAPYLDALVALPGLVDPNRKQSVLDGYLARDGAKADGLLQDIDSHSICDLIRRHHWDAWIYQVHPSLWQAAVYRHFIHRKPPGTHFNQCVVARWVRDKFGREQPLYDLFQAQYAARRDARKKFGPQARRIRAWYFTDEENSLIPDFYAPINWFIGHLVRVGAIQPVPAELGGVVIR